MNELIGRSAEIIGLFCRQQTNVKKELPVRSSEMGALIFVERQEGQVTPLMLSAFFQISKPSVTTIINSLVKKQFLRKIPSSSDGRSYSVELTPSGRALVSTMADEYYRNLERLQEEMGSAEFGMFIDLMQKATDILGKKEKQ